MVKASGPPEIDTSIESWIFNMKSILNFPVTVLTVISLLVAGSFAEIAPRKSLEFMDNVVGNVIFFMAPLAFAYGLGWPTGLLAAVVSLIIFTRLQKEDIDEGFVDSTDDMSSVTKIVSNPHRWFVEKMLGERPVAISSDRVLTRAVEQENRTSSAGSPGSSSHGTSSSNTSSNTSASSLFDQFNSSSSNK